MKDYTKEIGFWQRLESFVKDVQIGCAMDEEEKDMILHNCKSKILDLQNVSNNEVIMKKKKQRELIQSIIKSDEKDDIYSEVMVCDCKKEWSEWEWKHNKCRK